MYPVPGFAGWSQLSSVDPERKIGTLVHAGRRGGSRGSMDNTLVARNADICSTLRKTGLLHGDAAGAGEPLVHATVGVRMIRVGDAKLARAPSQETVTPVTESAYLPVEAGNDDAIDEPARLVG